MKSSEQIDKIAPALIAVQKEIAPVIRDAVNPHFKSHYATLDSITEYVRPILAERGLAVIQGGGDLTNGGMMIETTLLHSSGQWISQSFEIPVEKNSPQAAGSTITYGRRYGLAAFLTLTTEEDDDANMASAPKRAAGGTHSATASGTSASSHAEPPAARASTNEESCPKCAGRMWDNRKDKKNPRAPDFKCRDRSCDGVIWPPKDSKPAFAKAGAESNGKDAHEMMDAMDEADDASLPF